MLLINPFKIRLFNAELALHYDEYFSNKAIMWVSTNSTIHFPPLGHAGGCSIDMLVICHLVAGADFVLHS